MFFRGAVFGAGVSVGSAPGFFRRLVCLLVVVPEEEVDQADEDQPWAEADEEEDEHAAEENNAQAVAADGQPQQEHAERTQQVFGRTDTHSAWGNLGRGVGAIGVRRSCHRSCRALLRVLKWLIRGTGERFEKFQRRLDTVGTIGTDAVVPLGRWFAANEAA